MPSTREKQSKQVGEEILELLTKPTAKERSVAEKFKSHGGAQVMEFCPHGTKVECFKAQQATAEMEAKKKAERLCKMKQQKIKHKTVSSKKTTVVKVSLKEDSDINEKANDNDGNKTTTSEENAEEKFVPLEKRIKLENNSAEDNENRSNCSPESATEDGEIVNDEVIPNNGNDLNDAAVSGSLQSPIEEETRINKCTKLHFKKIIQNHTDESLGDCSFLNTCFHMATCK